MILRPRFRRSAPPLLNRQRGVLGLPQFRGAIGGSTGGAPPATDPYFSSVFFLAHMDGTNGSTVVTNVTAALGRGVSATVNGSASISTTLPLFGPGSLTTTGGNATSGPSADYNLSGAHTVEASIYTGSPSQTAAILDLRNSGGFFGFVLYVNAGTFSVYVAQGVNTNILSGGTVATNTWQRVAYTQDGSGSYLLVNGVLVNSTGFTTTFSNNPAVIVGADYVGTAFTGKIDEVRITKGVCRYNSAYTPAAAAFPDS